MTAGYLLDVGDSMFYEDFLREWTKIRRRIGPNNDKIIEELRKVIDFKTLTYPDRVMGNPSKRKVS